MRSRSGNIDSGNSNIDNGNCYGSNMNGLLNVKATYLAKEMPNDAQTLGDDSE